MRLSEQIDHVQHRGPGFDRIRLIAAFIVVLHHCSIYVTNNIAHDFLFAWSRGQVTAGSLAVSIFFATSGVLVAPGLLRDRDIIGFAVNRALRIMPALAIAVVATALLVGPLLTSLPPLQYFQEPGTWGYLLNLGFRTANWLPGVTFADGSPIVVNGALWTLYFEVLSYAALVVVFRLGLLATRWIVLAVFLAVYLANAAAFYSPAVAALLPDTLVVFLSLFVYFFAGVLLYRAAPVIPFGWRWAAAATVVAAAAMPLGIGVLVLPVLVPYVVVSLGYSRALGRTPLRADYSYGVYLSHAVVLTALLIRFPQIHDYLLGVLIVGSTALLLAALSWRYVESPALRYKKAARETLHRWRQAAFPAWSGARNGEGQPAPAPAPTIAKDLSGELPR